MNSSFQQAVREYLQALQQRITTTVEALDGRQRFVEDRWHKTPDEPLQGEGVTRILEGGAVFERAGVGFSHVRGARLPPSATQHRPELAGAPFEAMGVSLVFHPRNPHVPTVHMNVRMIAATAPGQAPVCWFGGGMDLTPYYGVRGRLRAFPPRLPRRAGALWRRQIPALQNLVRRVFREQAPQ
jgi:coproporphyrinogen III oxidase